MRKNDVEPDKEEMEDAGPIREPFNPNLIRVKQITLTVYNASQRLLSGELELAPEFQRRQDIWPDVAQSRLIESLLVRIPLPAFYLAERPRERIEDPEKYTVVDGVQRLNAISRFVNKKVLSLSGLEFLVQLNGKKFEDLPPTLQRRLLESQLIAYVIEPGTPPEAELTIFKRINTGGLTLSAQEIRHAMSAPRVRKFLETLAEDQLFAAATGNMRQNRMDDRECVARFFAFRQGGVERYTKFSKDLDSFILEAMSRLDTCSDAELSVLANRFRRAMSAAHNCFADYAFRKVQDGRRGPVNKSLFEATSVALDEATDETINKLAQQRDRLREAYASLFRDDEFRGAVTAATGDTSRVVRRFAALRELVKEMA
jgi:hypothetical protein